jgi:hypothetical protein
MPSDGLQPDQHLTDAAWNACAVASIYHREALDLANQAETALAGVLHRATRYGLTTDDLCRASGLDRGTVVGLLVTLDERRAG